jgi:hypothetical protein
MAAVHRDHDGCEGEGAAGGGVVERNERLDIWNLVCLFLCWRML